MAQLVKGTLLIACIGDIGTVTGLLLTGMGERNAKGQQNFMVVDKESADKDIEAFMRQLLHERTDIGIILIQQSAAERVRHLIADHDKVFPTILEVPNKENPYDPEKDPIVMRAAGILWGADTGAEKLKEMQAAVTKH